MKLRTSWIVIAATCAFSAMLFGQDKPLPKPLRPPLPNPTATPPARPDSLEPEAIEPRSTDVHGPGIDAFLDADALAVARVDLKEIDLKALQDWVLQGVDDLRNTNGEILRAKIDVKYELTEASAWVEKLRAAGAQHAYAVVDIYDITADRPPFVVIPVESGADEKEIEAIFNQSGDLPASHPDTPVAREFDHAVVVAVPATLERLKKLKPQPRPELASAFEAAGKGPIHLAVIPSEEAQKTLETLVTDLPDEVGGGPITLVTRGVLWICMAIDLPPTPSMRHVLQARNVEAAQKLKDIMDKAISWAGDRKDGPPEALAFTGLVARLKPQVEGDRVVIDTKDSDTHEFAAVAAANVLAIRIEAERSQAMSHLQQLSAAVFAYASDHQGEMPKDLGEELNRYSDPSAKLLWNDPIRPNQKQPYVYIRLANKQLDIKNAANSIMIYENHSTWDNGVSAVFADGHVEWITNEAEFKQKLSDTKKVNTGSVEMPQ